MSASKDLPRWPFRLFESQQRSRSVVLSEELKEKISRAVACFIAIKFLILRSVQGEDRATRGVQVDAGLLRRLRVQVWDRVVRGAPVHPRKDIRLHDCPQLGDKFAGLFREEKVRWLGNGENGPVQVAGEATSIAHPEKGGEATAEGHRQTKQFRKWPVQPMLTGPAVSDFLRELRRSQPTAVASRRSRQLCLAPLPPRLLISIRVLQNELFPLAENLMFSQLGHLWGRSVTNVTNRRPSTPCCEIPDLFSVVGLSPG